MKYLVTAILTMFLIYGCIKQSGTQSLDELKFSIGACGDEADRLSKIIDDPAMSPSRKVELCQQASTGITLCEEKILDIENDFYSSQSTQDNIKALEYLEAVKHKIYVADILSKACTCAKTKEDFDSRIKTDITLSGKQLLRVEKFCALQENCASLITETLATEAARKEALDKFNGLELDPPLQFLSQETATDFTAYCTDMLADLDNKITSVQGEPKERFEIEKALKHLYCTDKVLNDFDSSLFPEWIVLLGQGKTQESSDTLEKYENKYNITFTGDEFNCPAIPFDMDIVKFEDSTSNCSRGVQDSCGALGGVLDPVTCECKNKNTAKDCQTYASDFSSIGTNPKSINYTEGVNTGLSAEESCTIYAYQDISTTEFCNGKDQQLYAIYNSENKCCVQYWIESVNQPDIGPGGVFCGYKQRTTNGIWQKVSGTEPNESLYHADWLGQHAFPSMGETCQDIESQINLIKCS